MLNGQYHFTVRRLLDLKLEALHLCEMSVNIHQSTQHNIQSVTVSIFFSFSFSVALQPNAGHGLLIIEVSRLNTMTYHSQ
jgi:hypothetical protein